MERIEKAKVLLNILSGLLEGPMVTETERKLRDLKGIFQDESAFQAMNQDMVIYSIQAYMPVKNGTSGGLFFGNSTIYPGRVGNEYFMTRGHFHVKSDTAEYYWCIQGEGMLVLMDKIRQVRIERMEPGSVHYIPGNLAHRAVNTGKEKLVFNACWSSDAGHDYRSIDKQGFSVRLIEEEGKPKLIKF